MNCPKCGSILTQNDAFCPKCGAPVQQVGGGNATSNNAQMNYSYERPVNQTPSGYQQTYTSSNNYGTGERKSVLTICLIVLIIVAVIAVAGFLIYLSLSNNKVPDSEGLAPTTSGTSTGTSSGGSTSGGTTTTTPVSNNTSSSYKVNYLGFNLYIPNDLGYQYDGNNVLTIGDGYSWAVKVVVQEIAFDQLKLNEGYLSTYVKNNLAAYSPNVTDSKLETIDGVEYILCEVEAAGQREIVAVAGLNSQYSAILEVINQNNDYDRNILKNLTSIIKTVEYSGNVKGIQSNINMNLNDVANAVKKAIEEK